MVSYKLRLMVPRKTLWAASFFRCNVSRRSSGMKKSAGVRWLAARSCLLGGGDV